jgi:uncharacterized protein
MGKVNETSFAPIAKNDRIEYMDMLRGIAVFGILIANLRWFSLYEPGEDGRFVFPVLDKVVWLLQNVFIEGKFYSIFSFLFGWGIALQIERSRRDDVSTAKFIWRRLGFMLLLGAMHMLLLWEGDIVFLYGIVGFVLFALRRFSNRTLLITGVLLLLSPILLYSLKMTFSWFNRPSEWMTQAGEWIYQQNGWVDQDTSRTAVIRESKSLFPLLAINLGDAPYRFAYLFFVSRIPKVLGAMLLGFVAGRTGFYAKIMQHRTIVLWATICGLLLFVPLNYWLVSSLENDHAYHAFEPGGLYYTIAYALIVFPLAAVYMAGLAFAFENRAMHKILSLAQPVGRTAFSNYILHSIVGIITFYGIGIGFGLMGQFGPFAWTVFGVLFFACQVGLSNLWLRRYRFGPVEWIWRSLSYRKLQPVRIKNH